VQQRELGETHHDTIVMSLGNTFSWPVPAWLNPPRFPEQVRVQRRAADAGTAIALGADTCFFDSYFFDS
jgi:hypothetical protein